MFSSVHGPIDEHGGSSSCLEAFVGRLRPANLGSPPYHSRGLPMAACSLFAYAWLCVRRNQGSRGRVMAGWAGGTAVNIGFMILSSYLLS